MKDSLYPWETLTKARVGVALHACNLSIQEVEVGQPECQAYSWLHKEFKDSMIHMRPCLKEVKGRQY